MKYYPTSWFKNISVWVGSTEEIQMPLTPLQDQIQQTRCLRPLIQAHTHRLHELHQGLCPSVLSCLGSRDPQGTRHLMTRCWVKETAMFMNWRCWATFPNIYDTRRPSHKGEATEAEPFHANSVTQLLQRAGRLRSRFGSPAEVQGAYPPSLSYSFKIILATTW